MIIVYFEKRGSSTLNAHCEEICRIGDEKIYNLLLPALEAWADKQGGFITESFE